MKHPLFLLLLCAAVNAAHAQSTAFTYQGRLAANGLPHNGSAEVQFTLFSTPTGGSPMASNGPAVVNVSAGLFTIALDFGAPVFDGADRWLEIQVRTNIGAFFTLNPRQPVTPAPFALYARTAGTAGPWGINGSNVVYNSGKVGIGTTNPGSAVASSKLDVVGGDVVVSSGFGFFSRNGPGTGMGAGIKSSGAEDLEILAGGKPRILVGPNGHVRIGDFDLLGAGAGSVNIRTDTDPFGGTLALLGTDNYAFLSIFPHSTVSGPKGGFGYLSPGTSDLTIANAGGGRIVLSDAGGTHLPTCGEESLRIVRGSIIDNGPDTGSGFSVTNGTNYPAGDYIITFSAPFSATPTVTATPLHTTLRHTLLYKVEATHVEIIIYDDDHAPQPGSFAFIAIGPR